jgi:Mg2+ and Co2+ transporter CorA
MDIRWIAQDGPARIDPEELSVYVERPDGVLWVHVDSGDDDGIDALTRCVHPRPEDVLEISSRSPVPKLHMYSDHHFSAINGLVRGIDGLLHFQPLKVFLTQHALWTIFGPATSSLSGVEVNRDIDIVRQQIDESRFRPTSAFDLLSTIRGVMLRGQEEIIASGARRVADLEGRVMVSDPVAAESVLQDLFELRHDLQIIRINAAQAYELYDGLLDTLEVDERLLPIDTRLLGLLRQRYGHLKNSADLEREYLQEVLDLLQTRVSNELSRFVRKITAYGTIAVAWTVIAGIYGMNFVSMPELNWTFGYPAAIGLMLVIGIILWYLFRRQRWL